MAQLSEEQLQELRVVFELYDKNNDGRISAWELEEVMRSLDHTPTETELHEMIQDVVSDATSIDFPCFVKTMAPETGDLETDEELRELFRAFDKSGSGFISFDELRQIIESLGVEDVTNEDVEMIMREADIDGDGQISYQDFVLSLTAP